MIIGLSVGSREWSSLKFADPRYARQEVPVSENRDPQNILQTISVHTDPQSLSPDTQELLAWDKRTGPGVC